MIYIDQLLGIKVSRFSINPFIIVDFSNKLIMSMYFPERRHLCTFLRFGLLVILVFVSTIGKVASMDQSDF